MIWKLILTGFSILLGHPEAGRPTDEILALRKADSFIPAQPYTLREDISTCTSCASPFKISN